ncbi:hypothetical protein DTL42_10030 [Bremerella cremea]|uniref:Uncharacterized protein n=2 Tax=Bremerella cremea TaxID=1031537 RepID=A0A368KSM6_9BACT|nr:hypothetical protein DTL42_10030 [Bremerella cremea]
MAPLMSTDYTPLDQALSQLRFQNGELETFIDQLLSEITHWGQEVESYANELINTRRELEQTAQSASQLAEENQRLNQIVQQQNEAIDQTKTEIAELQQQLSAANEACQAAENRPTDQQRIAELEHELSAARSHFNGDESLLGQVEQLRRELAATKLELLKREQAEANESQHEDFDTLKQRNEVLEGELHQVRGHALRLTETIDQQRKEMNQQKSSWTEEMQAMRSLLERRMAPAAAQPQSFAETSVINETATVARDELEIRANNNNTVVDSVMAQFAKLQRDVNKRRNQQRS